MHRVSLVLIVGGSALAGCRDDSEINSKKSSTKYSTEESLVVSRSPVRQRMFPRNKEVNYSRFECPSTKPDEWTEQWMITCREFVAAKEEIRGRQERGIVPADLKVEYPRLWDHEKEAFNEDTGIEIFYDLDPVKYGMIANVFRGVLRRSLSLANKPELPQAAIFKYQFNCYYKLLNQRCDLEWEKSLGQTKRGLTAMTTDTTSISPFCYSQMDEDILIDEFVISKILSPLDICPKVYFLSRAVEFPKTIFTVKTNFGLLEKSAANTIRNQCIDSSSSIRLIVEEAIGSFLDRCLSNNRSSSSLSYPAKQFGQFAVRAFKQIIKLLRRMHTAGFIHGDIHLGNIGFRGVMQGCDFDNPEDLLLIDFGMSEFFPQDLDKEKLVGPGLFKRYNPALLSPFELAGFRRGRRDDIYRAFDVFMNILTRNKIYGFYQDIVKNHKLDHEQMSLIKAHLDLIVAEPDLGRFAYYLGPPLKSLPQEIAPSINNFAGFAKVKDEIFSSYWNQAARIIKNMHEYVRGNDLVRPISSPDSEPDYEWLIQQANNLESYLL